MAEIITPRECLEPPDGTGDLSARALWPQAFDGVTGAGLADVEAALKVYITEGTARAGASDQDDDVKVKESVRQWARHRSYRQAYERAVASALSIGTDEGFSASMTMEQINALRALADEALMLSDQFLVPANGTVFIPPRVGSFSAEVLRQW